MKHEWLPVLQEMCQCVPECLIRGLHVLFATAGGEKYLREGAAAPGEGGEGAQVTGHGMVGTLCVLRICRDSPLSFGGISRDVAAGEETCPVCS